MKKILFVILMTCLSFSALGANKKVFIKLSPAMQQLCAKADTRVFKKADGLNTDEDGHPEEPYHSIERGAGYEQIKKMMKGKNPDEADIIYGFTPIVYSAASGNWPATKALIDLGASVNLKVRNNPQPLDAALSGDNYDIACKLLTYGAQLPKREKEKASLFHTALVVASPYYEDSAVFIEFLLNNEFDVNDIRQGKKTALMLSAALGNTPAIKVLLNHGADIQAKDSKNETALDIARKFNHKEAIKLLEDAENQRRLKKAA